MADPGSQQTSSAIANFTTDVATIPVIINCFDDVWAGVATDAYNALSAVGFHGTCFAANSLIGTAGYIAWSGCQNLHAAGWDISNHGVIHEDMSGLTQAQAEANIGGMRTILQGYGFNRRNEDANFAFPYGSSSAACYAACLTQGIRVARLASDPNGQAYLSHGSLRMTPFGAYCCSPGVSGVPATDWATLKAKLVSMTMRGDVAMIMWHNEATTWGSVFVQAMQWMAQMQRCGLFKVMSLTEYLAAA
jgi:peptidoglycan/xylan/chitin deacetylase (PgdA/CDA1 family)